ncbi:MAG: osmotically inducible protein C [Bacteroidia bacterium]|nr:MAG: osmotically inducible protein C [Bacteroidia bacterium]
MSAEMIITFEGKKKVNAEYRGQTIRTDQSVSNGGDGAAPEPFSLFLASIGTCAGIYAKSFCDQRGIASEKVKIVQTMEFNPDTRLISKIKLEVKLPPEFPEKYKSALVKTINLCAVKRHLQNPPEIQTFVD